MRFTPVGSCVLPPIPVGLCSAENLLSELTSHTPLRLFNPIASTASAMDTPLAIVPDTV
jgi:hypothetical protein